MRMELTNNRTKIRLIIASGVYLLLFICGIVFVGIRKTTNLPPIYVINIGVDLFGMLMGIVLFIACIIDVQKTGSDQRYFLGLLGIAFLGLFTDLTAWLVDELPALRTINILDNTLYYMCTPIEAFFFWRYITNILKSDTKQNRVMDRAMSVMLAVSIALRILNLFNGMYFTVDAAGVYHRSHLYPLSPVYSYIAMLVSGIEIVAHRKKLKTHQIVTLLFYVAVPTAVNIFRVAVFGLSLSFAAIMLLLLLMYCVVNIDQGREKMLADQELGTASQIQDGMLPSIFPAFPDRSGFDLYASMEPAREVGGDFYDFFFIDEDHLCLVIADVSGKGVPAALFMMASKIILANNAMSGKSPAQILADTNAAICSNNRMEMFVTVWLGILEVSTGKLTAANAGHEYPSLKRADGGFELHKDRHGFVIGGVDGVKFSEYELQMEPGSTLFLYTDGVPEATNARDNMFGTDRMLEALNRESGASPKTLLNNVKAAVERFVDEAEQFDDLTMLCIKYTGEGKATPV